MSQTWEVAIRLAFNRTGKSLQIIILLTENLDSLYIHNIMMHNRVKVLRVEKQLSRKDLADAVGVNFQTIGYLERGDYNASLELAFRLAEFFELPVDMIFNPKPFKTMAQELAVRQVGE